MGGGCLGLAWAVVKEVAVAVWVCLVAAVRYEERVTVIVVTFSVVRGSVVVRVEVDTTWEVND